MEIKINERVIIGISDLDIQIMQYKINADFFDSEVERRLSYALIGAVRDKAFSMLVNDWKDRLKERYDSIPTREDSLAQLIFSQPDYKDRKTLDFEAAAQRNRPDPMPPSPPTEETPI